MSLATDAVFYRALKEDTDLMQMVSGRIYPSAVRLPDAEIDNAPVPYIIITFGGGSNEKETKDEEFEGDVDTVKIGIIMTATTPDNLVTLTKKVRSTIRNFMRNITSDDSDYDDAPLDYHLVMGEKMYNSIKPCDWQEFTYECVTKSD